MTIYPQDSPERDFDREQAAERRASRLAGDEVDYTLPAEGELEQADFERTMEDAEDERGLPYLQPVALRPVKLSAPEFAECPECGARGRHICPAKD